MPNSPISPRLAIQEDGRSETGAYTVRFFDAVANDWASVPIDDCIPSQWRFGDPQMVFSQPSGGECWVALLEKAMAKFCGDYAVLNGGGAPAWAFLTLLGPEKVDVYLRFDEKGTQGGSHATGGRCPRGRATCARWLCPSLTVVQPLRAQDVVARVQTRPGAPRPERRAAETDAAAVGATRRHAHARRDLGAHI